MQHTSVLETPTMTLRTALVDRPPSLQPPTEHRLVEAHVVAVTSEADDTKEIIHLDIGNQVLPARRAASCLLKPAARDRVLVSMRPESQDKRPTRRGVDVYVLAVLDRGDRDTVATLDVAGQRGDISVRSAHGALHLDGEAGLRLTTRRALLLSARNAELIANKISATTKRAIASFGDAAISGTNLDTAVERLTTRAARAFRFITETDQTRAQHIDARASSTARLSSKAATVVTSAEVVKVDASQVLIG